MNSFKHRKLEYLGGGGTYAKGDFAFIVPGQKTALFYLAELFISFRPVVVACFPPRLEWGILVVSPYK